MGKPSISVRIRLWLSNFLFMKVNYKNRDLKTVNRNSEYRCSSCELHSHYNIHWCMLFCRPGKMWMKDIFNSDIFRL